MADDNADYKRALAVIKRLQRGNTGRNKEKIPSLHYKPVFPKKTADGKKA